MTLGKRCPRAVLSERPFYLYIDYNKILLVISKSHNTRSARKEKVLFSDLAPSSMPAGKEAGLVWSELHQVGVLTLREAELLRKVGSEIRRIFYARHELAIDGLLSLKAMLDRRAVLLRLSRGVGGLLTAYALKIVRERLLEVGIIYALEFAEFRYVDRGRSRDHVRLIQSAERHAIDFEGPRNEEKAGIERLEINNALSRIPSGEDYANRAWLYAGSDLLRVFRTLPDLSWDWLVEDPFEEEILLP